MSKAYDVVRQFEAQLSEYTGAKYAVCVESCSAAIFLSLLYCDVKGQLVDCPCRTYPSVPASIIHAGGKVQFVDVDWQEIGSYKLSPFPVYDCAKIFAKGMGKNIGDAFKCLSFHGKKILKIGRGGAILTDSKNAYEWLKCARFDGRHETSLCGDTLACIGWNMYMSPEQAARGLELMQWIGDYNHVDADTYPDLSKQPIYQED